MGYQASHFFQNPSNLHQLIDKSPHFFQQPLDVSLPDRVRRDHLLVKMVCFYFTVLEEVPQFRKLVLRARETPVFVVEAIGLIFYVGGPFSVPEMVFEVGGFQDLECI